jgi:hypothetical protein
MAHDSRINASDVTCRRAARTADLAPRCLFVVAVLAVPKLRQGSYFPDWLLTHRRRAEQARITVVATAYLLGVSTRRVEKLAEQLGIKSLSRSQVSEMATHLDTRSPLSTTGRWTPGHTRSAGSTR